jgi:hypothetical protein
VSRIATDGSSNQSFCQFSVTVVAPQGNYSNVLQQLLALRDQVNDKPAGRELNRAILDIVDANALWLDSSHILFKQGSQFFERSSAAVAILQSLAHQKNSPIPAATLQDLIAQIVVADRVVAETAVSDAAAANVNGNVLLHAGQEVTEGNNAGSTTGAIGHYSSGWKLAETALNK